MKNYFSRLMSSAKKWEFIVWWIFRLIMIGAMVSLLFTNPPSDLPIVLLCALGFSFFISTCWELFEFSFDQIAGGDSQHWSYELAKAANNTRTFFKPRDPARFALMDTMTDIVFNTLGAVPFYIILKIAPYHHKGKNNVNEMFAPKGAEKEFAQVK